MATQVRFSELAIAGARHLFEDRAQLDTVLKSITLALKFDPTRNAIPFDKLGLERFWLRGFFAGSDIRVLFELGDPIIVWSIGRASTSSPVTE